MSSWGKVAAVVDHAKRRVLIWRDTTNPRSAKGPDVTLNREGQGSGLLSNPVSVAVDGKRLYVGDATLHQVLVWNTLPANDDQPPDAILGRAVTADSSSSDKSVRPDDISWPATLGSDGSNLFVGDPLTHRILVFSPADQRLDENSVSNSASFAHTPFAPGTLITLEGSGLSEVTESSNSTSGTPAPTMLGGTEVLLDGVALPIFSVLRGKLQSQIPYSIDGRTSGSLYLRTRHATGEVTATVPVVVEFASTSPGLFAFPGTEPRVGIALRSATEGEGQLASPVTPESKVQPGDVLTLWASGLGVVGGEDRVTGPRDSLEISSGEVLSPVRAEIDGQPVRVVSARLPDGAQGVYEVRIAMPATLKTSPAQLTIFQDGLNSNTITLPVQH